MRSYQDKAFAQTRAILLGQEKLPTLLAAFAAWIGTELEVPAPVNIRLVPVEPLRIRARLEIIFTYAQDAASLRGQDRDPAGIDVAAKLADRLRTMAAGTQLEAGARLALDVRFFSFEEPARWKANSTMPDDQIERIESALSRYGVWKIFSSFDTITFLFHTDAQVEQSLSDGSRTACEQFYAKALAPYDRLGFFARRPIEARFDSKESFERDYGGSWLKYGDSLS